MRSDIVLSVEEHASEADRAAVIEGLTAYNRRYTAGAEHSRLSLLLRDAGRRVVGGLLAETEWDWLHVKILWVHQDLRGQGFGRALMERAEAEARGRGCRGIHLDTFEFQARGFYEKLGFQAFGVLDDFPPGYSRIYLRKRLDSPP